jgi:tetratricopeptide (TPR) repeat protein
MTLETKRWLDAIDPALEEHFDQLRYARAAALARAGRYLEAEGLLTPHGVLPAAPHEPDLLARLAARQGRYDTARCLWRTALRSAPDDAKFVCCLEAIDHAEQRQWLARAVFRASFWIGLVLAIAWLVLGWFRKPHF